MVAKRYYSVSGRGKLADSLRQAINSSKLYSNPLRIQFPTFGGKPDDWHILFLAYERTKDSFNEEDNLI